MNSICDKLLKDFSFSFNVEVSGAASASFTDQSFQWNSFALCETAKTNTVFYFHSDAVCSVMSTRLICWHIVSSHSPPDWLAVITTSCFQQGVMGKSHKLLRYIFVVVFLLLLPFTKLTLFNSPPAPTVLPAPEGLKASCLWQQDPAKSLLQNLTIPLYTCLYPRPHYPQALAVINCTANIPRNQLGSGINRLWAFQSTGEVRIFMYVFILQDSKYSFVRGKSIFLYSTSCILYNEASSYTEGINTHCLYWHYWHAVYTIILY